MMMPFSRVRHPDRTLKRTHLNVTREDQSIGEAELQDLTEVKVCVTTEQAVAYGTCLRTYGSLPPKVMICSSVGASSSVFCAAAAA